MTGLNSFVACIVLVICSPLIFARPGEPTVAQLSALENNSQADNGELVMTADVATHRYPRPNDWGVKDPPCKRGTYKFLFESLLSNSNLLPRKKKIRDDYQYTPNVGLHKFHSRSVAWNVARKICREEGGHLAIINSQDEARVLTDLFNRAGKIKNAAFLNEGFIGIHDYFAEGDWVTVLDEPLATTGFTKWSDEWGGQPDNIGIQNCGSYVVDGFLDDIVCSSSLPFFCEIPMEENV